MNGRDNSNDLPVERSMGGRKWRPDGNLDIFYASIGVTGFNDKYVVFFREPVADNVAGSSTYRKDNKSRRQIKFVSECKLPPTMIKSYV